MEFNHYIFATSSLVNKRCILLQCKNFARSIEYTVRLKVASDEKSVLAGSELHTVKILLINILFTTSNGGINYSRVNSCSLNTIHSGRNLGFIFLNEHPLFRTRFQISAFS